MFTALTIVSSFMGTTLQETEKAISATFDDLTIHGHSGDLNLQDMIKDGAWVDSTKIPVLNPAVLNHNQIFDIYRKHVNAAAVNWAWHKQRVWIMSYPMTEAECKSLRNSHLVLIWFTAYLLPESGLANPRHSQIALCLLEQQRRKTQALL